MSFKMICPHCKKTLSVNEMAVGRTLSCPGCDKPIKISLPDKVLFQAGGGDGSQARRDAAADGHAAREAGMPLPPVPDVQGPPGPSGPWPFPGPAPDQAPVFTETPERRHADMGSEGNGASLNRREMGPVPGTRFRRPAGLVWIVFFWSVSGVALVLLGVAVSWTIGALAGATRNFAFPLPDLPRALLLELGTLCGLLLFHFGILMEVTCYGLWTFRRWGFSLARKLAVVSAVGSVIGVVIAIVAQTAIVTNLAGLVISVGILGYFYGRADLSDRFQQVLSRAQQGGDRMWEGYD